MKKYLSLALAILLVFSLAACNSGNTVTATPDTATPATAAPADGNIKVGIVNNPPSESGYREANVKDFESVFSADNGYDAKTFYSLKNDEQLNAAQQFITDGVD